MERNDSSYIPQKYKDYYPGYGFLEDDKQKQSRSSMLIERYSKEIKSAFILFFSGFGFLFLSYLPIELSEENLHIEKFLRDNFFLMSLCFFGHSISFWLVFKFIPSLAGFVSWVSMWIVIPTVIGIQFL